MVTDRDLAVRALAEDRPGSEPAREHASRPLVTGEPDMDLEEAAALMVQHRIRRLPIVDGGDLVGDRDPRRHRRADRGPRGRAADDPGSDRGSPARLLLPRARIDGSSAATPQQRIWRDRFESLIGLAAPMLDLVLNAGDRVSRALPRGKRLLPDPRPGGGVRDHPAPRRRRAAQAARAGGLRGCLRTPECAAGGRRIKRGKDAGRGE